jgi:hypothetical protein
MSEKKENKKAKKKSLWGRLFGGFDKDRNDQGSNIVEMNSQGAVRDLSPLQSDFLAQSGVVAASELGTAETEQFRYQFPIERLAKYSVLSSMDRDPTINAAITLHVNQALSAKTATGEIISIESTSDKDNIYVKDLRDTFKELINKNCQGWAYNAALNGVWYVRPYGAQGVGIKHVRSDFYTHPRFIKEYEHGGQLAGYTHAYQDVAKEGRIELMEPWKFVAFKIPNMKNDAFIEPIRYDQEKFDIGDDDCLAEELLETQTYGKSIIETAFDPWMDLQNAILSVNMSRRNAARLERVVGVNTGKLSPRKAAEYLNSVAGQLKKANEQHAKQAISKGFFQTVINHLIPIFGDRGRLDISTVEGSPNIEGLEDIMLHVKRVGGAVGADPSLLGFGDMLSGGLGEGGYFRMSVLAAVKSNLIRQAIRNGIEELFNIHIAFKYGKYFLPGQRPWRIVFNSISTAVEREEMENMEGRVNFATMVATLVQTMDPEFSKIDFNSFNNYLWTDILRVDEEKYSAIFPKKVEKPEPGQGDDDPVLESATTDDRVNEIIDRFYERGNYAGNN